ncbi:hypothetical protein ACFOZZ_05070 [Catenibacterium sp. GCM10023432]
MTKIRDCASPIDHVDEELIDTLIAISVVAKRRRCGQFLGPVI